jgi:hypothetical protein
MEQHFEETQRFPRWIRVTVVVPVVVSGAASIALLAAGSPAGAAFTGALAVFLLALAIPNFVLAMSTKVDGGRLELRLLPLRLRLPFLPPRTQDVPLSEITRCVVRTYRPLTDRDYWGSHFWGLGRAFRGKAYLYLMDAGPFSGRGVEVELRNGERILVGSRRPEALAGAITRASGPGS